MQPPDFGPGRANDPDPDLDFALRLHNFYWGNLYMATMGIKGQILEKKIVAFCQNSSIIEKIYFWLDRKFGAWVNLEFSESNRIEL